MSDNKNLLNENTIRRFMKLASLHSLADSTVEKVIVKEEEAVKEGCGHTMDEEPAYMQEDEEEEFPEAPTDDLALDPEGEMADAELDMDDAEGEMADAELDMDAAEGEVEMAEKEALAVDVMDAVAAALDAALGTVTTVVGGDEEPGLELDDTEVVDLDGPVDLDEPELDLPVDDLEIEDEDEEEEEEEVMEEAAVNQIVDRVAARLTKEVKNDKKDQLAESLADKIFARLTTKNPSK